MLFAAFRLPELTRYALWYDEVFSLTLAQMPLGELLSAAIEDLTNPPLFYILLKGWIAIGGESVAWMRLLPCVLGIIVAVPLVSLARRWIGIRGAAVAAAIGAASPLAVFLTNELRGYSLFLLAGAAAVVAHTRVVDTLGWEAELEEEGGAPSQLGRVPEERLRRIVLAGIAMTLLVYSHYFGWLLVAALLATTALWHRGALPWVAKSVAIAAVAFAPWAIAVGVHAAGAAAPLQNVAWIAQVTWSDVPRFFDALVARVITLPLAPLGLAVLGVAGIGVYSGLRQRTLGGDQVGRLITLAMLPVAVALVVSVVGGPQLFVPRYLLVVAVPYWLLVAAGAAAWRPFAAVFVVFTLAAGAARQVRGGEKVAWDALVAAVRADAAATGKTDAVIYSLEAFTGLPAAFYAAQARADGPAVKVRVSPVSRVADAAPGGWLVLRSSLTDSGEGAPSPIMAPTGAVPIAESATPSQRVAMFRIAQP
ncbi:MAG: hypothetical protein FJ202_03105 [Gemmatimonadetes bacterium]|nr:hypothetical protein [Gemmatimonadota bacterium]